MGSTTTGRRLPRTTFSAVDPNSSFSAVPRADFADNDRIDREILGFLEDLDEGHPLASNRVDLGAILIALLQRL